MRQSLFNTFFDINIAKFPGPTYSSFTSVKLVSVDPITGNFISKLK